MQLAFRRNGTRQPGGEIARLCVAVSLCLCVVALLLANLFFGAVALDTSAVLSALCGTGTDSTVSYIVTESRLPAAVTAAVAGAGLGVAGLLLQTAFHNPLAGPSVMGISNGAALGVALVTLCAGGVAATTWAGAAAVVAALAGAMAVTVLLLAISAVTDSHIVLLVAGMMVGYLISSVITLLTFRATADGVQGYVVWGMGDFTQVARERLPWLVVAVAVALAAALPLCKSMDAYQLGGRYAESLGFSPRRTRAALLVVTGTLAAVVTAFCGPVSFLGLAVPHIARLLLRTDTFRLLMPATMLVGAAAALLCNLLCTAVTETTLPLAAVTPIIGAPVVLWVILRKRGV